MVKRMIVKLRRYFITGLLLILPVFLTFYLLFFIVRFIDGFWGKMINTYLLENLGFFIPGLGFILGILSVVIIGFIVTHLLSKRILPVFESWFLKLPFVRQIYPAIKQIVSFFLSKERPVFKKVILAEYPSKGIWSVGFVTNEGFKEAQEKTGEALLHVFIGSTPGPFTGYFVMIPKENVKFLNMSVEEGFKLIASGGILSPYIPRTTSRRT